MLTQLLLATGLSEVQANQLGLAEALNHLGWSKEQVAAVLEWEGEIEYRIDHGDYEYSDNYRYARIDNADEMAAFGRASDSGCCGSHEEDLAHGVLVGFNYGH